MSIALDSDRALENEADDYFGFVDIAKRLAPSILEASRGEGMVVGLEGRWGSGKTSLLNFLRQELAKAEADNIHTITIAPWLNGDSASMVMSLLGPIAEVLEAKETEQEKQNSPWWKPSKHKVGKVGEMIRDYGQKTARRLAPLASLVGHVLPGGQVAAGVLEGGANALEQFSVKKTPTELKRAIAKKIRALGAGFIVILDDLDRLEPAQAVEVIRLVRSVADFPNVAYLMCYDREILAQALKTGLKVKDGDLFLQKIVQVTFAIPLPEPFDLRLQFRKEAEIIYREVTGAPAEGELQKDLEYAIDHQGMLLTTPREVKLALNGIRFLYKVVADDVYFPDLCRLHLIKNADFELYKWLELYLAERSVLVTGDASITGEDKSRMGKKLKRLAPSKDISSSRSIWHLGQFVPGLQSHDEPQKRVFTSVSSDEARKSIKQKRLGSPLHYRFYFALTAPKTVLKDSEFEQLLRLAHENVPELVESFKNLASKSRHSGKTWFEHVLNRLDQSAIDELDISTATGIIHAVTETMDLLLASENKPKFPVVSVDVSAARVVSGCFKRISQLDHRFHEILAKQIAREGRAINWLIARFFRNEVWDHGRVGDRQKPQDEWVFSDELLEELIAILQLRIEVLEIQDLINSMPDVAGFLYGWRDILGSDGPKAWVEKNSERDDDFLRILGYLRSWAMSDKIYYPLNRSAVSAFFDFDRVVERLNSLRGTDHDEMVRDLQTAMEQARN